MNVKTLFRGNDKYKTQYYRDLPKIIERHKGLIK